VSGLRKDCRYEKHSRGVVAQNRPRQEFGAGEGGGRRREGSPTNTDVFRLPSMCRREMKFTENKTIMEERRGGVGRKEIFPVEER
jgi:hypothetical protein